MRHGVPALPPSPPSLTLGGSRSAPSGREARCRAPDHPLSVESFNVPASRLSSGSPLSLRCFAPSRLCPVPRFAWLGLSPSCALARARLAPPFGGERFLFSFGCRPYCRPASRRVSRSRCPRSRLPRPSLARVPASRWHYLARGSAPRPPLGAPRPQSPRQGSAPCMAVFFIVLSPCGR